MGWGWSEAPRGALGHWVHIKDGKIANYQAIVPSTWNGSPRDANGLPGAYEAALVGTPVADPEKPLEVLRTVHSFDPCMACAVHILDPEGKEVTTHPGCVDCDGRSSGYIMGKDLVLGVGNLLLSDEGIGIHAVRRLDGDQGAA